MEYGPQACGLCHSRSISFPLPFPGAICLGRCAYICGDIPQITTNSTEKRASRASAQRSDSWCPTLSAPPIGPALPPDSSRWSPFIVCMYVCMHVCIARKFFTAFSVGSNQMWCNNYYVHSFGFFSPRTKVYLFFGKKYSGLVIVNFITIKTICTSCRVQLSWELMRP